MSSSLLLLVSPKSTATISSSLIRCNYCYPSIVQKIRTKCNVLTRANFSQRNLITKTHFRSQQFDLQKYSHNSNSNYNCSSSSNNNNNNNNIHNIHNNIRNIHNFKKSIWSRYFLNVRRQTTLSTPPPTTEPPHITTHKKAKGPPRGKSSADTLSPRAILILKSLSVVFVLMGTVFSIYLGRPFDSDRENQYKDLGKFIAWYKRFQARGNDLLYFFTEPPSDKLLPDKNSLPNYSPYTLVINLDQTLIYSTWDREHGWRTAKRPGVDYFLFVASNLFEVVIFTSQPSYVAEQILMKLDPLAMVPLRLYRESTRYVEGKIVKDLSKLNRDLSKVIIMDSNPDAYSLQPENAIAIPPWKGDPNDTFLIDIIPFLEHFTLLSPYEIDDVRPILKQFQGKDVPKAYAEWEEQWKKQRQMEYEKVKNEKKGLASFVSAFGVGSSQEIPPYQQALLHRQMAHDGLLQHYKSIKEQSPELQRAMKQDMDNYEKQIAERMKEQKMTLWQLATQGPPQIIYTGMQEQQQSDYQNYQTSPESSASSQ
ncbi:hypothetical protein Glove_481g20 [Diversispora epigaea]|uniref:Mitochondrial import inner membrane translocase subunit TIM50 n=1 Tax=Diversispora epigaea TaxID=1348612 RepID=A0A397GQF5_9GLOM|nr:hypothetical protein Glove_481g20 [Diversispora epigaea]